MPPSLPACLLLELGSRRLTPSPPVCCSSYAVQQLPTHLHCPPAALRAAQCLSRPIIFSAPACLFALRAAQCSSRLLIPSAACLSTCPSSCTVQHTPGRVLALRAAPTPPSVSHLPLLIAARPLFEPSDAPTPGSRPSPPACRSSSRTSASAAALSPPPAACLLFKLHSASTAASSPPPTLRACSLRALPQPPAHPLRPSTPRSCAARGKIRNRPQFPWSQKIRNRPQFPRRLPQRVATRPQSRRRRPRGLPGPMPSARSARLGSFPRQLTARASSCAVQHPQPLRGRGTPSPPASTLVTAPDRSR